ncbi:hypothetical protein ACJ41O_006337 [Fusarium nematophilum]
MLCNTLLAATAAILAGPSLAMAAPRNVSPRAASDLSLTAQLRLADTVVDRFKLLPDDKDFVFDFSKGPADVPSVANGVTFPALVGTGASMTVGQLDPCSMAIVHLHPRSAELQVVISGRIYTEMVPEAGVVDAEGKPRVIRTELGPNQMTVFYQGSFHTQVNTDCEPATVVTSFASEDIGVGPIAHQTFALSNDTIIGMFGQAISGEDIDAIRHALPQGVVTKVDECLAKCNIKKRGV